MIYVREVSLAEVFFIEDVNGRVVENFERALYNLEYKRATYLC